VLPIQYFLTSSTIQGNYWFTVFVQTIAPYMAVQGIWVLIILLMSV